LRLRSILLIGLLIRLAISPFLAHPFDVYRFYFNGENFAAGTVPVSFYLVPYRFSFFLFAFPATLLFNFISGQFGSFSIPLSALDPRLIPGPPFSISLIPGPLFDLLVKLPLILSDLLVAIVLFRLVLRYAHNEAFALSATTAWLLNPFTIWVSSAWGMWDTLPALFALVALYLALDNKFFYAALALIVSIALKLYAGVLLPPLFVLAWRSTDRKAMIKVAASFAIAGLSIFALSPVSIVEQLNTTLTESPVTWLSFSGLSIWSSATLFSGFNPITASLVLLGGGFLVIYAWMWTKRFTGGFVKAVSHFCIPIAFLLLFFRFIGENFVVWLLPFTAILSSEDARTRQLYWIISGIALLSSVTNTLLPYYFLPVAPSFQGALVGFLSAAAPYRAAPGGLIPSGLTFGKAYLSALGVLMFMGLLMLLSRWLPMNKRGLLVIGNKLVWFANRAQRALR